MSPSEFLRRVWSDTGYYCLVRSVKPGEKPNHHLVFETLDEVDAYLAKGSQRDLFFSVLTLRERKVWSDTKVDYKTKQPGAWQVRTHNNMGEGRALFLDLDVGEAAHKYPSLAEAREALDSFVTTCMLPTPSLISSGGGWHVYWHLETPLPAEEWRVLAHQLRVLVRTTGLRADPARLDDLSSILRVPGSFHCKDPENPKLVKVVVEGDVVRTDVMTRLLNDAAVREGAVVNRAPALGAAPKSAWDGLASNTGTSYDGPVSDLADVGKACALTRAIFATKGDIAEPSWYAGIIGLGAHMRLGTMDSDKLVHTFSRGHPQYSPDDTDAKLAHHREAINAPTSCAKLSQLEPFGDQFCKVCPHFGQPGIPNPLAASRRTTPAPAPVVQIPVPSGSPVELTIPDPPKPFLRLKEGGVARLVEVGEDGDKTTETIYNHDLYPLSRLVNHAAETENQLCRVCLPREQPKEFQIPAEALYDLRMFARIVANHGIYPHKSQLGNLQEYMVAYISELQKMMDADVQRGHLGWSQDFTQFALPGGVVTRDSRILPANLSEGAAVSTVAVHSKGGLLAQVEALRFYNHSVYRPHQMMILASLSSPFLHMTGHRGMIVNVSGESGASKTTGLYAAGSVWGEPETFPINGTKDGATIRARNERLAVMANLPACVDEITNMPFREAQDLALSISQPGHRLRLKTDGTERSGLGGFKSSIMIATANNSLHSALAMDNPAGTAGSMRVFEIIVRRGFAHTKAEADAFLRDLRDNYGHLGPALMAYAVPRYTEIKQRIIDRQIEIDTAFGIEPHERYWSAVPAVAEVICEICNDLGLLFYPVAGLRAWFAQQLGTMRTIVKAEYATPLMIMTDFIDQIHSNIIVVTQEAVIFGNGSQRDASTIQTPHGPLLGHYQQPAGQLALRRRGFRDHCARIGANANQVLDALHKDGVVVEREVKRTIGAGTCYAKTQSWCFVIDMTHPDIAATLDYSPGISPRKTGLRIVGD